MAFNIEDFKARGLQFGGARPSTFEVILTDWPGSTQSSEQEFRFHVKASQIPPSVVGQVEVPYFGRRIKVLGDRQYANWNVSVLHDEDYSIRETIEQWHQNMNGHVSNLMDGGVTPNPESYKRNGVIRHYSKDGSIIKTYTVEGIFPTQVDAMPLDWEAIDQVMMFDVEFSIDYFLPYEDGGLSESDFIAEGSRTIDIG